MTIKDRKVYGSKLRKSQSPFMVGGDGLVTVPMFVKKEINPPHGRKPCMLYISIIRSWGNNG